MIVALIILSALVAVGALLWALDRHTPPPPEKEPEPAPAETSAEDTAEDEPEVCCGMHITCEKDSLLASVSPDVVYFDDEELDRFRGRGADEYSDAEIEEFRDVLLTLIPSDIAPWGRSLQLRGITLPAPVKEELLFIVAEARNAAI